MRQIFNEYIFELTDFYLEAFKEMKVQSSCYLLSGDYTQDCKENGFDFSKTEVQNLISKYPQFSYLTKAFLENRSVFDFGKTVNFSLNGENSDDERQVMVSFLLAEACKDLSREDVPMVFDYLKTQNLEAECHSKCFALIYKRFPDLRSEAVKVFSSFLEKTDPLTESVGKDVISIFDGSKNTVQDIINLLQKIYEKTSPNYRFASEKRALNSIQFFRHCSPKDIPEDFSFVHMLYATRFLNAAEFDAAYSCMDIQKMMHYDFGLAQRILPHLIKYSQKIPYQEALSIVRDKKSKVFEEPKDDECSLASAALALSEVFGVKFKAYLDKVLPYLNFYEAVSFIKDIDYENPKNEELGEFLMRNVVYKNTYGEDKVRELSELESICRAWKNIPLEEIETKKYDRIFSLRYIYCYDKIRSVPFSKEAMRWNMSIHDYVEAEQAFLDGQGVREPFDTRASWTCNGYVGRFLPRDDVRVGFFGNYTGCCQYFVGAGKAAAISSVKDDFAQLFVIEKDGRIVAGSFVWENVVDGQKCACFDSVEISEDYKKKHEICTIYEQACNSLSQTYERVTLGENPFSTTYSVTPVPIPPNTYTDAEKQYMFMNSRQHY